MATAPPNTWSFTKDIPLTITPAQIHAFNGQNGMNIQNYVIKKSQKEFRDWLNMGMDYKVPLSVRVTTSEGVVSVKVSTHAEELITIVEKSLMKHQEIFIKKSNRPKVCKLVFKTNMEHHLIGKFIGASGRKIKALTVECMDVLKDKNITEERVNISIEPDKRINMHYVDKFFIIRNSSNTEQNVLITLSVKFSGDAFRVFKALKKIMISSVTDMFVQETEYSEDGYSEDFCSEGPGVDFLSTSENVPTAAQLADGFLTNLGDEVEDEGTFKPTSPTYHPQ